MSPGHRYVGPRRNPGLYILDRESGVARGDDTVLLQAFQQAIDRLTTNADHHCEISLFRSPVALAISQADFSLPSLHPKIPFPAAGFSTARSRSMSQSAQTARHLEFLASGSERDRAWTGTLSPEKNYWL